jgi:hypothetical protein
VSDLEPKAGGAQAVVEIRTSTAGPLEPPYKTIDVADLKQHPVAEQFKFPALNPKQLQQFADDLAKHGMHEKIVIHEGMVLEGWTRYAALKRNGYRFNGSEFCLYDADWSGDPACYVISRNVFRRHLPEDQRAAWAEADWQQSKQKPGPKVEQNDNYIGKPDIITLQCDSNILAKREKTPAQQKQESRERKEQVAAAYGTTVSRMEDHTRLRKADPEKAEEVKAGKTTLREASQEVAKRTGWQPPRKPKETRELKDGLTLRQIFQMMLDDGYQKLEGRVAGLGRVIFITDAEIKNNPGTRATESEVIEYCTSRGLPKSDGQWLFAKWEANKWTNNNIPIKDWRRTIVQWQLQGDIFPSHKRAPMSQRAPQARSTVKTPAEADRAAAAQAEKMKASLERQQKLDGQEGEWNQH